MYKWMKQEIGGIFSEEERQSTTRTTQKKNSAGRQAALSSWRTRRIDLAAHGKLRLRLSYKGQIYDGILNKNGRIECYKGVFETPSGAAKAVVGRDDNGTNGWYWWRFERTPGEWRPLRELGATKTASAKTKMRHKAKEGGKWPGLRDYLPGGTKLRMIYKGQTYHATVKGDGRILYRNQYFETPSGAAKAVKRTISANGWYWWHYEKSQGEWVRIDELREKRS